MVRERRIGIAGLGGGTNAIQKFDLFERRLRTARRRADRGQILDGEHDKKKRIEEQRRISLPASRRPRMCGASLRGRLASRRFSPFRSSAFLGDSAGSNRVIIE